MTDVIIGFIFGLVTGAFVAVAWIAIAIRRHNQKLPAIETKEPDDEAKHYYCDEGTEDDPTPTHRCGE